MLRSTLCALAVSMAMTVFALGDVAQFHVLDVGQGDAILVISPEGKTLLIDAGGSDRLVRLLRGRGVSSIDLAVISHHHLDHYSGLDDVIRVMPVRNILMTNSSHTTLRFRSLLRLIRDQGIRVINPTGETRKFTLGSVVVHVFPQQLGYSSNENNNCIGLRVEHGDVSMVSTGDSESTQRRWWMANVDPRLYRDAAILKVAHHGSGNGIDPKWLAAVNPELAVISVGKSNQYHHPNAYTLHLIRNADIPLLRTDEVGTISIESDGRSWWLLDPATSQRGPPIFVKATTLANADRNISKAEPAPEILTHWLNLNTKVRHNSDCRWYQRTERGRMCQYDEGRPCGKCGG